MSVFLFNLGRGFEVHVLPRSGVVNLPIVVNKKIDSR